MMIANKKKKSKRRTYMYHEDVDLSLYVVLPCSKEAVLPLDYYGVEKKQKFKVKDTDFCNLNPCLVLRPSITAEDRASF